MSRGAQPVIPDYMRRQQRTHCDRGHEISGYNARPQSRSTTPRCRACHVANLWAARHNLFNDDPAVVEHAEKLAERYRGMAVTP